MNRRITIAATNSLGRRIRHRGLDEADRALLELVLADSFDALTEVSDVIRRELPDVTFTPRLKTVGTLVDKLMREEGMALSRMRDIAGVRVVDEMNRLEQDVLVGRLVEALGIERPRVDRRRDPRYGYRAVHVEAAVDGCFVEIQVRTRLQDLWAQIVERLADNWGRQIRYGGSPPDAEREIAPDLTRADVWTIVQDLSTAIDTVESSEAEVVAKGEEEEAILVAATNRRELAETLRRLERVAPRL